jgi:threonine aldolase
VVLSTRDLVERARVLRKRLGGGMRQVGIIAAAGIYAVTTMRDRIVEDHRNARRLAEGMDELPGLSVDLSEVETNIVFVRVLDRPAAELEAALGERGVLTLATSADECRFVTHADVSGDDIGTALDILKEILR